MLLVEPASPDKTVAALRDILIDVPDLFERGAPARLARDQADGGSVVAQILGPDDLVLIAHQVCRPVEAEPHGIRRDVRLPRSIARMYLGWRGEWKLQPLNGITSTPLLRGDGTILSGNGYDPATGIWQENVPELARLVPADPTVNDALASLRLIREAFRTFCFADAATVFDSALGVSVVDIDRPPGKDESAFLVSLLTAVCRPSLALAPGTLLRAAPISGAGTGKGLLARSISIVAFGQEPHAVTAGPNGEELEKRIAAELIQSNPVLFLDNLNNVSFRSNLIASALTERPSRVRILGRSQMLRLNASAYVVLTGNGLSVSEDLVRRFIVVNLDAGLEEPERRPFDGTAKQRFKGQREELLAALLTIWRWGRQARDLRCGLPLGSFEEWSRWVRDPLVTLGCTDPVARLREFKRDDARRQAIVHVFRVWLDAHGCEPVPVRRLDARVRNALDPHGRGRQYLASSLISLTGTRIMGHVLTRQAPAGKWGASTFALKRS